ncbi:MAG: PIN domain-containing protein [Melioribacteraceae bacterium]|nr:PIN domain-containing protein [Melioribacteraceae bacterium]
MTLLIDTDILLDIALQRTTFYESSAEVVDLIENKDLTGFVAWHTLSNFYYIAASGSGKEKAQEFIHELLDFVNVAKTGTDSAKKALRLNVPDFEDALQISAVLACNADFIITRNFKHYKNSPIKALTPEAFLRKHYKL